MKYTLRQLQIFLAVAKHRNISKAAESLHMSQSAASEALIKLERTYNLKLFDRVSNNLSLNAVSQALRKEAENLLLNCDSFEEKLLNHTNAGHLKIGASYTIGNYLVTRYLADYLSESPNANIDLVTSNTPDIVSKVLNYQIDVGMIENEVLDRGIELIPWREDRLVVFCASSHPLAERRVLTKKDIREARWILREPSSGARQTFSKVMSDLLSDINIYLEFEHNEAIKNAVESGLGIGCLSQFVLQKNFDHGDLVPLEIPKRNMRRSFYFALPKDRQPIPAVDTWMETCRALDQSQGDNQRSLNRN